MKLATSLSTILLLTSVMQGQSKLYKGLRGQDFEFGGKHGGWYANLAASNFQWNVQFHQMDSCPKEGLFVTGTSMLFFTHDEGHSNRTKLANSIAIKVKDKNDRDPRCSLDDSTVCLGNGSLVIVLDGEKITTPGNYYFKNEYGRVIAHNTFGACSRKWVEHVEKRFDNPNGNHWGNDMEIAEEGNHNGRRLRARTPIEYLLTRNHALLDENGCSDWLEKRYQNNDIFQQKGDWTTIYIETPLATFHVQYRKQETNDEETGTCTFETLDIWINRADFEDEELQGILGETAHPKHDSFGNEITRDRAVLLSAEQDEAYEVENAFGTEFQARKKKMDG